MSAFDPNTESPPAIVTYEQSLAHHILLGHSIYGAQTYQELQGVVAEKICDTSIITAADGSVRLIGRVSIELDPAYVTSTAQKLWMFAKNWGTVPVPASYKVD